MSKRPECPTQMINYMYSLNLGDVNKWKQTWGESFNMCKLETLWEHFDERYPSVCK